MVEDALLTEMRALQEKVAGITGTAVASRYGLIVREDTGGVNSTTSPRWPPPGWHSRSGCQPKSARVFCAKPPQGAAAGR